MADFFQNDACRVAQGLLGKVIRRRVQTPNGAYWLAARIIETEAYYLDERGSHASLGYTEKRRALFMPAGTIYMYYARGGDSLNISTQGEGNAVLIKAAFPYEDDLTHAQAIAIMQQLNPGADGQPRPVEKLCRGQTLLCRSLAIKVPDWDAEQFDKDCFYIDDTGLQAEKIIQTTRLGIPSGRDEHLHYRFIDHDYARFATSNPLTKRGWREGREYRIIHTPSTPAHTITPTHRDQE
ncbi:MAG TPA: DNA-3-methyladenine glycosylase [Gammaproteobacteria bacterium]|nr:DNA-3-methyladenine glycosylase [Gammaproteobacteria bacterium]